MKLLLLHCDFVKFRALKEALKEVKALGKQSLDEKEVKEALVVLIAVEKKDSASKEIAQNALKEIKEVAKQVKTNKIVLYPYAHLSKELASPKQAMEVLNELEKISKKEFDVSRAPFGYYKSFELKVKGHPLSELSREIAIEGKEEVNHEELIKKMSKIKMSTQKVPGGLKNNIELGRDLDLYIVSEIVGGGLPLFTPKGTAVFNELKKFIQEEETKRGYKYTKTPIMAKSDLYKVSGHWQHYKDDMFVLKVRNEDFALRPMTCPFQFILYKRKPRSYKELPIRYAEIADLFRNEKSGELRGLTRVRQFSLADAHILCTEEQVKEEFKGALDLLQYVMKTLGIKDIWYRFSKWGPNKEKYIDNPKAWEKTQKYMKNILDELKIKYLEAEGEAAFYGPKLDLQYKDVYGKEDTLLTIQIDFAGPERFDLSYNDEKNQKKRPFIIHRSALSSIERMFSLILEKTQGAFPLWLAPVQVKVVTVAEDQVKFAKEVSQKLREVGIRVEEDYSSESIGKKVKRAQLEKIFYTMTLGGKEQESNTITLRNRTGKLETGLTIEACIDRIKTEVERKA